jgi:hypothetical protein
MGGQTLYFGWPCRIRRTRWLETRVMGFYAAAGIFVKLIGGGVKALTYRLLGSYLIPAAVSLWLHLNVIY